ncbi:hypothetical protein LP419_03405 [Massilia sp. H-1]|nr:hypothetical protein LP419_03405 [Massilia sp. H-1]
MTHQVLRGASFATPARFGSARYRNFYKPERDDIFASLPHLRLVRLGGQARGRVCCQKLSGIGPRLLVSLCLVLSHLANGERLGDLIVKRDKTRPKETTK